MAAATALIAAAFPPWATLAITAATALASPLAIAAFNVFVVAISSCAYAGLLALPTTSKTPATAIASDFVIQRIRVHPHLNVPVALCHFAPVLTRWSGSGKRDAYGHIDAVFRPGTSQKPRHRLPMYGR